MVDAIEADPDPRGGHCEQGHEGGSGDDQDALESPPSRRPGRRPAHIQTQLPRIDRDRQIPSVEHPAPAGRPPRSPCPKPTDPPLPRRCPTGSMWLPWLRRGAGTVRDAGGMREEPDRRPGPVRVAAQLFHYTSPDEDSARWWDFPFRPGDIVVSTRSKSGTTWVQMICLLLVFQTPDLPGRLAELSPWLDFLVLPKEEVFGRLAAQTHRRVIKTHTPLDGVPLDDRATYIVVGRHPLDVAVSLYHHSDNIDRRRMAELTGQPETPRPPRPPLHEWLLGFVEWDGDPRAWLDTLPGAMLHLSDAWARRHRLQRRARALRRPPLRPRRRHASAVRGARDPRRRGALARAGPRGDVRGDARRRARCPKASGC